MRLAILAIFMLVFNLAHGASGSINAPASCDIPSGSSTCSITFSYTTTGANTPCLWIGGAPPRLAACNGQNGSYVWSWQGTEPRHFYLLNHSSIPSDNLNGYLSGTLLARKYVEGLPQGMKGSIYFQPCKITSGSTCTTNANYEFQGRPIGCLWLKSSQALFSCAGNGYGSQAWSFTTISGTEMELRLHTVSPPANTSGYNSGFLVATNIIHAVPSIYPTATAYTHYDFFPLKNKKVGIAYAGSNAYSKWATQPSPESTLKTNALWGIPESRDVPGVDPIYIWDLGLPQEPSIEEFQTALNCTHGLSFIWQPGYVSYTYGVHHTQHLHKAEIVLPSGTYSITPNTSCMPIGIPYALLNIPTQPYRIKVWGEIRRGGDPQQKYYDFYWDVTYSPPTNVYNSCWEGTGATKLAVAQEEVWWTNSDGYWHGGGNVSLDSNGVPDGISVTYPSRGTVALDAGWLWTSMPLNGYSGTSLCLAKGWDW